MGNWVGPDRIWLTFADRRQVLRGWVGMDGLIVLRYLLFAPVSYLRLVVRRIASQHRAHAPSFALPRTSPACYGAACSRIYLHSNQVAFHSCGTAYKTFTTRSFLWGHACVRCVRTIRLPHGRVAPSLTCSNDRLTDAPFSALTWAARFLVSAGTGGFTQRCYVALVV